MRRLVELTGLSNRREHRRVGGPMGRFAPHLEAVVVSQNTYELASQTLPELLKQGRRRRTHAAGRGLRAREKVRAERRQVRRQHRDGARAGRSLSPVYPGTGLHLPRHQHPRALQVAHARRRRAPSLRARAHRLGGLLDQRASAGTAPAHFRLARSAHARPPAAPRRAIARWPKCWTAPPSAMARGPH